MDEEQLAELLRMTTPSCLKEFRTTPAQLPQPFDDNLCSVWQIACRCGDTRGRFLGYRLQDYNPDYNGAECFLSPLAFECATCKAATELLDTDRHGYHPEVARRAGHDGGVSTKLRGEGPRQASRCPSCGGQVFEVKVGFVFWGPGELAEEFVDHWEELFSVFLCYCKCAACGQTSEPTDFGKL
jgi:hypothetical protein